MRLLLLVAMLATLSACHRAARTTADGLPISDKQGVTGDGLPANAVANSD